MNRPLAVAAAGLIACSAIAAFTSRQIYKHVVTVRTPTGDRVTIATAERMNEEIDQHNAKIDALYARIEEANAKVASYAPQVEERTVDGLISDVGSTERALRIAALQELADRGGASSPAVAKLLASLRDDDVDVRLNASLALGAIGRSAVTQLVDGLADESAEVRYYSALALGLMGKVAEAALPAVERATKDANEDVRRKAEYASKRIQGIPLPEDEANEQGQSSPGFMPAIPFVPPGNPIPGG